MKPSIYRSSGAESAAICHILMNRSAAAEMLTVLRPDDFGDALARAAFERIKAAYSKGMDIQTDDRAQSILPDFLATATPELMGSCRTAMSYIIDSTAREKLAIAIDGANNVLADFSADNSNFRQALQEIIAEAVENRASGLEWDDVGQVMEMVAERAHRAASGVLSGITTGYDRIDEHLLLEPGTITTIGARPGTGKTALCLSMAIGQLNAGLRVGYACTEMGSSEIGLRLVSQMASIPFTAIQRGHAVESCEAIRAAGVFRDRMKFSAYCAKPNMTAAAVRAVASEWRNGKGLDCLYVDYLQDLAPMNKRSDRTERVEQSMAVLKETAQDLGIPIVLAAQLRRETEGSQPEMGHLKDASKIEEASHVVALMWRPDCEKKTAKRQGGREVDQTVQLDEGGNIKSLVNRAGIFVTKNRNGRPFEFAMDYDAPIMRFDRVEKIQIDR